MAEKSGTTGPDTSARTGDVLELAPELQMPESEKKNFWGKLKRGLFMTHTEILEKVSSAMEGKVDLDEPTLEYLEEALISADLGVNTAMELVERVRKHATRDQAGSPERLRKFLVDEMADLLRSVPAPRRRLGRGTLATLVVGINGVGKTTSIAKLARRAQEEGEKVVLAAADTFRAAAIEQLTLWGERLKVDVVRQAAGL